MSVNLSFSHSTVSVKTAEKHLKCIQMKTFLNVVNFRAQLLLVQVRHPTTRWQHRSNSLYLGLLRLLQEHEKMN